MKVVLQVDGAEGFRSLMRRLRAGKVSVLFQGAVATATSALMGHYPWVSASLIMYSSLHYLIVCCWFSDLHLLLLPLFHAVLQVSASLIMYSSLHYLVVCC